jgi:hypothetical protein
MVCATRAPQSVLIPTDVRISIEKSVSLYVVCSSSSWRKTRLLGIVKLQKSKFTVELPRYRLYGQVTNSAFVRTHLASFAKRRKRAYVTRY